MFHDGNYTVMTRDEQSRIGLGSALEEVVKEEPLDM